MLTSIVCGFPGIGKSFLTTEGSRPYRVSDSDSSQFPKDAFPANYIGHLKQLSQTAVADGSPLLILCSTHSAVLESLSENGMVHHVVYPEKDLKEEYLGRYVRRGSPPAFLDLLSARWDVFMADLTSHVTKWPTLAVPHVLTKGQYLSDIISEVEPTAWQI